jgi:hypothetical protein
VKDQARRVGSNRPRDLVCGSHDGLRCA